MTSSIVALLFTTGIKGKDSIEYYGCGSCHVINRIGTATGLVGPSLNGIAMRLYVGGVLQNTPGNLERWIQNPKAVDEKAAMPNLGVTERTPKTSWPTYIRSDKPQRQELS